MIQSKTIYKYDNATQIFYKYYSGSVSIQDLRASWQEIIDNDGIPVNTKRFLLDYTKATYIVTARSAEDILEFYKSNKQIFRGAKIALIMQEPDQVVVPILVNESSSLATFKPFYTESAAVEWLCKV